MKYHSVDENIQCWDSRVYAAVFSPLNVFVAPILCTSAVPGATNSRFFHQLLPKSQLVLLQISTKLMQMSWWDKARSDGLVTFVGRRLVTFLFWLWRSVGEPLIKHRPSTMKLHHLWQRPPLRQPPRPVTLNKPLPDFLADSWQQGKNERGAREENPRAAERVSAATR
jgi:hypothetical protein